MLMAYFQNCHHLLDRIRDPSNADFSPGGEAGTESRLSSGALTHPGCPGTDSTPAYGLLSAV